MIIGSCKSCQDRLVKGRRIKGRGIKGRGVKQRSAIEGGIKGGSRGGSRGDRNKMPKNTCHMGISGYMPSHDIPRHVGYVGCCGDM